MSELAVAWDAWEQVASNAPRQPSAKWLESQAIRKEEALKATGLSPSCLHDAIAERRRLGDPVSVAVENAISSFSA